MSDLFSAIACPVCRKPVTELGCAPDDCRSPVRRVVAFAIPPGTPVTACRSCAASVQWIVTAAGKKMPVNSDGTSHFATCAQADEWRMPR